MEWSIISGGYPFLSDVETPQPAIYKEFNITRLFLYKTGSYPYLFNVKEPQPAIYVENNYKRLWYLNLEKDPYPYLMYVKPASNISNIKIGDSVIIAAYIGNQKINQILLGEISLFKS